MRVLAFLAFLGILVCGGPAGAEVGADFKAFYKPPLLPVELSYSAVTGKFSVSMDGKVQVPTPAGTFGFSAGVSADTGAPPVHFLQVIQGTTVTRYPLDEGRELSIPNDLRGRSSVTTTAEGDVIVRVPSPVSGPAAAESSADEPEEPEARICNRTRRPVRVQTKCAGNQAWSAQKWVAPGHVVILEGSHSHSVRFWTSGEERKGYRIDGPGEFALSNESGELELVAGD